MAVIAYKAFEKGLIATRGKGRYQFSEGINITEKAHCARCGFHCAEDPLDMFSYYRDPSTSEYRLVRAQGDIHEDLHDSRISCTEMYVGRELTIYEVVLHALCYWEKYPERSREDFSLSGYFRLKRGKRPTLSGKKGELLGFAIGDDNKIKEIGLLYVDGKSILPDTEYDINGKAKGVKICLSR